MPENSWIQRNSWKVYATFGAVVSFAFLIPSFSTSIGLPVEVSTGILTSLTFVVCLLGVAIHRPAVKAPWVLFSMCFLMGLVANVSSYVDIHVKNLPVWSPLTQILYLFTIPWLVAGIVMVIHKTTKERDWATVVDGAIFAMGLSLLAWIYLILPYVRLEGISTTLRITSTTYLLEDLAFLWVGVRLMLGTQKRHPVHVFVALATIANFIGDAVMNYTQLHGIFTPSMLPWVLFCWNIFVVGFGIAALHPSMVSFTLPNKTTTTRWSRLFMLALGSLVAPVVLIVQALNQKFSDTLFIGAVSSVMFVLVVMRIGIMLRKQVDTNNELDVTIKMLQQADLELRQAQRLKSVGQLAGGVAHELNTPLMAMSGNLQFIESSFRQLSTFARAEALTAQETEELEFLDDELPRAVDQTISDVGRAAEIVKAMKAFGDSESVNFSSVDLNGVISNTVIVASGECRDVADVNVQLGNLPPVLCVAAEIGQVLLNLITNASHSIADKGAPADKSQERGTILVSSRFEDDYAVLEVQDDGVGISAEIRDHIFDPFFTTREVGRGTGQGLSVAWALITERHGGSISFTTQDGVGTTFTVKLPCQPVTTPDARFGMRENAPDVAELQR